MSDAIYDEAIRRCNDVLNRAQALDIPEPAAMALATADASGNPTVRIVLLRGLDQRGFVFYTNSESRKGEQLLENPRAALCFYWDGLNEQVRVEGDSEHVSDEENEAYWSSRPRLSQLASAASHQTRVLHDRQIYVREVEELDRQYAGRNVPRPSHWFGYRVIPRRIEFWTRQDGRMHERTVYERADQGWVKYFVYP